MFAPLGNDEKGIAFELPNDSRKWRVIAATGKKGPGRVLRNNGLPLEVPIDADVAEFVRTLEEANHTVVGRYRLQAVDADGCDCCDTVAIMEFDETDEAPTAIEQRRNASPSTEAPQYHSELQAFLAASKDRDQSLLQSVRDLVETARRRDDDTLRTLRDALKGATESNSLALKALTKAHAGPHSYAEPQIEEVVEEEPIEQPPEQNAMEMMQKVLVALPQILEAVAFFRKVAPAVESQPVEMTTPTTAAASANGAHSNGVNGIGIHPTVAP